jgi:calpain
LAFNHKNGLELKNEFVLNDVGRPLPSNFTLEEYVDHFSIYDIFQGILGDCYLLAAIMGFTRIKELLPFVIPFDNANRTNMKLGAYHFRLWQRGEWFDVVVDDYLPVNGKNELFFTRNVTFFNEFWIPLFIKAIAK